MTSDHLLGVPIVCDDRIAPGVMYLAPVGSEPHENVWTPAAHIEGFSIGFDPTPGDPFADAVGAFTFDATARITMTVKRPSRRVMRILLGRHTPRPGPPPLSIDGHAYHRRVLARRRRG